MLGRRGQRMPIGMRHMLSVLPALTAWTFMVFSAKSVSRWASSCSSLFLQWQPRLSPEVL
jgi:hypothetical protein